MPHITPNFDRDEFRCRGKNCCGHSAPIALQLVEALQQLRDLLSHQKGSPVPIFITSGFRCITHDLNEARDRGATPEQLSVRSSQHCLGLAADIIAPAVGPDILAQTAKCIHAFQDGGIGRYTGSRHAMVHLDIRPDGPARWTD